MVKFTLGKKMKPVCLVLGAGAGIGGNVAKKFSKGLSFMYLSSN